MATAERVLTGARPSSAVVCCRKAVYEHRDAPRDPYTPAQERMLRRGKAWEQIVRTDIIETLREQGQRPRAEEEIPWPAAEPLSHGHADAYLPQQRTIVEIFSTVGGQLRDNKAKQAALYALNHRNAESAVVVSVDTHTGEDHTYPIDVTGLEPEIRRIEETVLDAVKQGELPDRVCRTPGDGPAQWCAFRSTCFEGWTAPEPDTLIGLDTDLRDLSIYEDRVKATRQMLKQAEEQRDQKRTELRPLLPTGEPVEAGGVTVKVSEQTRRSFSLRDALAAGHALPADLEPFVSTSTSERWSLKIVDAE